MSECIDVATWKPSMTKKELLAATKLCSPDVLRVFLARISARGLCGWNNSYEDALTVSICKVKELRSMARTVIRTFPREALEGEDAILEFCLKVGLE